MSAFIDSVFDKALRLGYVEMPLESLQLFVREIRQEQSERIRILEAAFAFREDNVKALHIHINERTTERDELAALCEKYRSALDAIYNHNEAARSAVLIHFGYLHPKDLATPILAELKAKTLEGAAAWFDKGFGGTPQQHLRHMAQELRSKT